MNKLKSKYATTILLSILGWAIFLSLTVIEISNLIPVLRIEFFWIISFLFLTLMYFTHQIFVILFIFEYLINTFTKNKTNEFNVNRVLYVFGLSVYIVSFIIFEYLKLFHFKS